MNSTLFLPPPFTWMHRVDLTRGNYNVPNNVIVCEVRCMTEGSIRVRLVRADGSDGVDETLQGDNYDIWRLRINRVYQFNTDRSIRDRRITLFGFYRSEIETH